MKRVFVVCEGETEEKFIKDVFAPYFNQQEIAITPLLVNQRGGALSYDRVKYFILKFIKRDTTAYITTMFDYYALDTNFPGYNHLNSNWNIYQKVTYLEAEFKNDINLVFPNDRFFPHIQPHEFESLLFSDINEIVKAEPTWNTNRLVQPLLHIVRQYPNPEEINNSSDTSPSRRLARLVKSLKLKKYRKILHGTKIAKSIGINNIRQKCNHFNEWCDSQLFN